MKSNSTEENQAQSEDHNVVVCSDEPEETPDSQGIEENSADELIEESASPSDDTGEIDIEEELEKWKDLATRSRADLENFRKRMARERSESIQFANRALLEALLPIFDNFEMGLQAAKDEGGEESTIYQGMAMVHKQIEDFLSDQGVKAIVPDGQAFDPNLHEAIKQEASDTVAEGSVIYTLRRGYQLKDRLLRAANVVVSSGTAS